MRSSASTGTPASGNTAAAGLPDALRAWTGRHDGNGPEHARWHQRVRPAGGDTPGHEIGADTTRPPAEPPDSGPQVSVLGFRSDEGVRRNHGRRGAADGPAALRTALAPLALHDPISVLDHGDAVTLGADLEGGQTETAALIATALDSPGTDLTVVLGGGHETAWASYLGLLASQQMGGSTPLSGSTARWGVLNLDAHFDLREEDRPTSGTPFAQMAHAEARAGRELNYAVAGISEPSNTTALFSRARDLGVRWMTDLECAEQGMAGIRDFVEDFARDLDVLYLTVDLDVLPAAVAPGVSAPAGLGVETALVAAAVRAAASTGKLSLLEVVELSPALDIDSRTARTAARLIDLAVRSALPSH